MFIWDKAKRKTNLSKHGIDFESIWDFDWPHAVATIDVRKEYGETRYIAFALLNNRLHCCVYTQSDNIKRIISLRKANQKEIIFYEQTTDDERW